MKRIKYLFIACFIFFSYQNLLSQNQPVGLKTPKEFFGFQPGTDGFSF